MAHGYDYHNSKLVLTDEVTVLETQLSDFIRRQLVANNEVTLDRIGEAFGVNISDMTMVTQEYLRMLINQIRGRLVDSVVR